MDDDCEGAGCVIGFSNQTLGEEINLIGTPYKLRYSSERQKGRSSNRSLNLTLSGATIPASLKRIDLSISVAGRVFEQSFPAQINQTTTFTWDGMDAYGRTVQGRQLATVEVGYTYDGVYQRTERFGYNGNGTPITGSLTRREITLPRIYRAYVGSYDDQALGLGGWTLDVHHFYNPLERVLYEGNGTRRSVQTVSNLISTIGGNGASGFSGDGGPATQAAFGTFSPQGAAVAPDGSVYVADTGNRVIRRIGTNGIITTVAGTPGVQCSPTNDSCGDGGQALQAHFASPFTLAFGPDGSYYVVDNLHRIRKVAPNGIVSTVAGTGAPCDLKSSDLTCGDGGPATQAQLTLPLGITVAPDGAIYFSDSNLRRVRRVGPDGIISSIAGNSNNAPGSCSNNNLPALQACLSAPFGVVALADGSVIFSDVQLHRIFRVGANGIILVLAGNGFCGFSGDGGPALSAQMCNPEGIGRGPDNSIYVADWSNNRIRRIGPDGVMTTYAGDGQSTYGGDNGPALAGQIRLPLGVVVGLDGSVIVADGNNHRVRRITPPLPGFNATDIGIPSADGRELYQFNSAGRHLSTRNTLTGATKYTFGYDANGRLITVTDGDNNVTTITRNGSGAPTGVVSPFNQTTAFTLDANGYLATLTNPNNEQSQYTYTSGGLLTLKRDPRNNQNAFTYDALGRFIRDDDAATGFQTLARMEAGMSATVTHSTALNRTTTYQTQELADGNRQRTTTLPSGVQQIFLERQNGLNTLTAPDGTQTSQQSGGDPRWQLQAPLAKQTNIVTPGALNFAATLARTVTLSTPSDPLSLATQNETLMINGRSFTSAFTAANRTFIDSTPQGRQTTRVIDLQGRLTSLQAAGLNALTVAYDARGRLASTTFGAGMDARTSTLAYHTMGNAAGFLASFTDPLVRVTSFVYDNAGRVTQQTLPGARVVGFSYDANGNLTALTPPGRPAHTFTYTALDLLQSYTAPGGVTTTFSYNLDRDLTGIARPSGVQLSFAYDSGGRLQTLTTPSGNYVYGYQAMTGQVASISAPGGNVLAYQYDGFLPLRQTWTGAVTGNVAHSFDNNFRFVSQSINNANTVNFTYDNDDLLTGAGALTLTRNGQTGLISGTTLGNVSDTRAYNNFAELTAYNAKFNAATLYDAQLSYDKLSRLTQKVEMIGGVTMTYVYGYDVAGRLQTVTRNGVLIDTYDYDSNDNRTSLNRSGALTNGTYDNQDRLTQYGAATYSYTANGEWLSKTVGAQTTQFSYDALGNLRMVVLPNATQLEYVIDGQNRRIGKRLNGALVQGFLYQDQYEPVAELDGANNLVSRFVYGSRSNVPEYMVKDGATYRFIVDQVGSVRLVVDVATGVVAQRLDYDEFGVVTLDTNPGFQPFGFAGGLYDPDTRLTRFGARDYDAETGRWTAKDPLLFAGGETNLYVYAQGDPVNLIDLTGSKSASYPISPTPGVSSDPVGILTDTAKAIRKNRDDTNPNLDATLDQQIKSLEGRLKQILQRIKDLLFKKRCPDEDRELRNLFTELSQVLGQINQKRAALAAGQAGPLIQKGEQWVSDQYNRIVKRQ